MTAPFTQGDERARTGQTTQARDAKESKLRKLLNMQDVAYADSVNLDSTPGERYQATRSFDLIEERIRILRGRVKPGSRNVSVRELSSAEMQKRLPRPSGRSTDYLADAARTIAQAEALSAGQQPDQPPDSQPK